MRYDYGVWECYLFLWHCQCLSPPPISSWKSFSYKPHSRRTKQGTNHSEMAHAVLRDLMGLNAKSVKRNSFGDSPKGQVDGSSDKSLMRWKSTTQNQYTWGGGLVSSRPFRSSSRGQTDAQMSAIHCDLNQMILLLWLYLWQTRYSHRSSDKTFGFMRVIWATVNNNLLHGFFCIASVKDGMKPKVRSRNTVFWRSRLLLLRFLKASSIKSALQACKGAN